MKTIITIAHYTHTSLVKVLLKIIGEFESNLKHLNKNSNQTT
jgi:hypothetical protein